MRQDQEAQYRLLQEQEKDRQDRGGAAVAGGLVGPMAGLAVVPGAVPGAPSVPHLSPTSPTAPFPSQPPPSYSAVIDGGLTPVLPSRDLKPSAPPGVTAGAGLPGYEQLLFKIFMGIL